MKNVWALMRRVADALVDAVLPLRERTRRTKHYALSDITLTPEVHTVLGSSVTTLMPYEGVAKDIVQSLKYDGSHHAAALCAASIAEYLHEEISSHQLFSTRRVILIPMPLHASRVRERGFNQIERVLAHLPSAFQDGTLSTIDARILIRSRATEQQTRLSRQQRLNNLAGAFSIAADASVRGTHVYLIDDVTTTGATLVNAATPLRRAGSVVHLIALARA